MNDLFAKVAPYRKLIVALIGAILTTLTDYFGDNIYITIATTLLTAYGVYQVPNKELE